MTTILMKRSREDNYSDVEAQAMANCLKLLAQVRQFSSSSPISSSSSKDEFPFQCKTCDKKFPSFQALGGHRASHKKPKTLSDAVVAGDSNSLLLSSVKPKMHRCSICGVEFPLGQALGGHMRRHRPAKDGGSGKMSPPPAVVAAAVPVLRRTSSSKRVFGFGLDLDLNLTPAENYGLKLGSTVSPKVEATPVLRCFI